MAARTVRKPPREGFSHDGLPSEDRPRGCECIQTSGGYEVCPRCGVPGRTKGAVLGGAPAGFYEFCGHKVVDDTPHRRDHRLDFSLHTPEDCKVTRFYQGKT